MAAMRDPREEWEDEDAGQQRPERGGRPASRLAEQETPGAHLLRCFHGAWRALVLRGLSDTTFQRALAGLREGVAAFWEAGVPARLVRHGNGLLVGDEALSPYSSGNLLAHLVAEELASMDILVRMTYVHHSVFQAL